MERPSSHEGMMAAAGDWGHGGRLEFRVETFDLFLTWRGTYGDHNTSACRARELTYYDRDIRSCLSGGCSARLLYGSRKDAWQSEQRARSANGARHTSVEMGSFADYLRGACVPIGFGDALVAWLEGRALSVGAKVLAVPWLDPTVTVTPGSEALTGAAFIP